MGNEESIHSPVVESSSGPRNPRCKNLDVQSFRRKVLQSNWFYSVVRLRKFSTRARVVVPSLVLTFTKFWLCRSSSDHGFPSFTPCICDNLHPLGEPCSSTPYFCVLATAAPHTVRTLWLHATLTTAFFLGRGAELCSVRPRFTIRYVLPFCPPRLLSFGSQGLLFPTLQIQPSAPLENHCPGTS